MRRLGALSALLLCIPYLLGPQRLAAGPPPPERLVVAQFTGGLPAGWKVEVREGKPNFRVAEGALHLVSHRDAYGLRRDLRVNLAEHPYLNWRWKALVLPKGGDGRKRATDDQAAQVYVAFPRWPYQLRTQMVGYTWENLVPRGTSYTSPAYGHTRYVVLRDRSDGLGQWVSEKRNVYEDYKRLFRAEPPEVGAVVLYINSQHTGSSGESSIADVYFSRN